MISTKCVSLSTLCVLRSRTNFPSPFYSSVVVPVRKLRRAGLDGSPESADTSADKVYPVLPAATHCATILFEPPDGVSCRCNSTARTMEGKTVSIFVCL